MKLITEEIEKVEILTEGTGRDKKLYITGPFLQSECVNRNGRMYPFAIMEKEVNRYKDKYINEGRALGELGHPCLSGDARLLTVSNGWKHIQDCSEGELVYTMNPETKEVEVHPIKKVVINDHKGILFTLKNRGINTNITPDHRFLVINSRNHNEYKFVTAQEIYEDLNGDNKLSKWYIPKYSLGLNKETPEYYVIPKSDTLKVINERTEKYLDELKIEFDTFAAFMGLYLSEGNCRQSDKQCFQVSIHQNEGHKADRIREVLDSMSGLEWRENTNKDGTKVVWSCYDRRLGQYLSQFGVCYHKFVPKDFIENLNVDSARTFLEYFILGDGRGDLYATYSSCDAFSTSLQLIDDIAQIAVIAGFGVCRFTEICEEDYIFAGRIIKAENKSPLHFCSFLSTKGCYLDKRFMTMTPENWDDKVYCIQVENTNFMVEQNGYTYWTGNCGPTINLDRVSHKIVALEQKGNNWIGKAQILETPMGKIAKSLLGEGVTLGVSSRGIGSLRETNKGYKEVGEDFMIATAADIVADPSAPDAFVSGIYEGAEWIYDATSNTWLMEQTKRKVEKLVESREYQERKIELFQDFLNSL